MKSDDARKLVLSGENPKEQYIKDYIGRINYDKIQHEGIRRSVEPKYTMLLAELQYAYRVFWKYGDSYKFQKFDVLSTKEKSEALYNELCNDLYDQMQLALLDENEKSGNSELFYIDEETLGKLRERVIKVIV